MITNRFNRFLYNEVPPGGPDPGGGGTPPATPPAGGTPPAAVPPVTPPAATPPPALIGADGKLAENWFTVLGDQFAPHAADLAKYKDLGSLVQQYQYFQKNGVEYPADGAQPAAVDRFRKIAGVPETAEGYGLTAENTKLPEGMTFDSELATAVAAAAHKTHAPPAVLNAIVAEFNTVLAARTQAAAVEQAAQQKAAQDELVTAWGGDFVANASTARHMASKLGEAAGLAEDSPEITELANKPAFAKMMLAMAKLTSEDRIQAPLGFGDLRSPADRIAAITSGKDPVWGEKYTKGTREERQQAYEYVSGLRAKMAQ